MTLSPVRTGRGRKKTNEAETETLPRLETNTSDISCHLVGNKRVVPELGGVAVVALELGGRAEFLSRGPGEEGLWLDPRGGDTHQVSQLRWEGDWMADGDIRSTYFPTCLFRSALSLAVQGLMMLSEGETNFLFRRGVVVSSERLFFVFTLLRCGLDGTGRLTRPPSPSWTAAPGGGARGS
jgi:hypothetical protein